MLIKITPDKIDFENIPPEKIFSQNQVQVFLNGYFEYNRTICRDTKAAQKVLEQYQKSSDTLDFNIFNGCYLGWINDQAQNRFILFNDRFGTYPLFYSTRNKTLVLSDSFTDIKKQLTSCFYDRLAITEILCGKYTSGTRTTIREIEAIQPGSYLDIKFPSDSAPQFKRYWLWEFKPAGKSYSQFADEFVYMIKDMFDDFGSYIRSTGKPLVVPTSGGYDSRLMISELSHRLTDVSGLIFGAPGCDDLQYGTQIVEGLNLPVKRLFLEPQTYQPIYESPEFAEIISNYNSRGDSHSATITSLLALDDRRDYIIFPGHSLDMQTGGHIRSRWHYLTPGRDFIVTELFRIHYNRCPFYSFMRCPAREITEQIRADIRREMLADEHTIGFAQRWDMENRQVKFIINAVREYEVKNFEWMMPGWDYRIQDFFLRLPFKYQFHQNFYLRQLSEKIFDRRIADINKKAVYDKYGYLIKHLLAKINPAGYLKKSKPAQKPIYPLVNPQYIHLLLNKIELNRDNPIFEIIDYNSPGFKKYISDISENVDYQYSKVTFYHLYKHLELHS